MVFQVRFFVRRSINGVLSFEDVQFPKKELSSYAKACEITPPLWQPF
jgi:hypothetical protein